VEAAKFFDERRLAEAGAGGGEDLLSALRGGG
jgi:hypothetical protein